MERYESSQHGRPAGKKGSATGTRYNKPLTAKEITQLRDEDIDFSDIPELDESFWENATIRYPEPKERVTMRLDKHILDFFRAQGRGYQTRINAVLAAYIEAQSTKSKK